MGGNELSRDRAESGTKSLRPVRIKSYQLCNLLNLFGLTAVAVYAVMNLVGLWTLRKIDPAVIQESEAHRVD